MRRGRGVGSARLLRRQAGRCSAAGRRTPRDDSDGFIVEVTVGESRTTQELRQRFIEGEVTGRSVGALIAYKLTPIDHLKVSLLGEHLQGGPKSLGSDLGGPPDGGLGVLAGRDADDGK